MSRLTNPSMISPNTTLTRSSAGIALKVMWKREVLLSGILVCMAIVPERMWVRLLGTDIYSVCLVTCSF